ncbi:MAG: hypothetical protein DRH50_16935 [Deltaproteobacteria bacterium]|nr:MAG: hypothetical protein DRH50_16935 [Deltaproteobacteria bacterium]
MPASPERSYDGEVIVRGTEGRRIVDAWRDRGNFSHLGSEQVLLSGTKITTISGIKNPDGQSSRRTKVKVLTRTNRGRAGDRGGIAQVREEISYQLVEKYGFPLAEVARQPGVTTSAISRWKWGGQ